jgi:hypothetical protein
VSDKRKQKEAKRAARKDAERKRQARVVRDARGRAHLSIVRDESGAPVRLKLERSLFREEWQNGVALAAASTAHGLLCAGRTLQQAVAVAERAMSGTSQLVDGLLARAPVGELACRAGCGHCCHQVVGATAPEALAIYEHLRTTRTPDELAQVVTRIREAEERSRGLTSEERTSPELPCPFLEEERCTVYEVRPLACRGKTSLDAAACERTLRDPEARAAYLEGSLTVPCYVEPLRAFHAVTAGMQLALHELHGLRTAPLELKAAMRILVDDPEGVPERWLAGEDPFEAARGADGTGDARLTALSGRGS